ncbi:HEAT repeat domain-containing protein [Candidatus Micrarchaeota archaeon]|nr:HEAT repeat domain-containing protein [Candidatus Micrarchaeota archaeon]
MKLIKSKNYVLMKDACYHLGTIKSDKAVPHSVKLLEDKNHFYDLDVVLALGKIGSEKAVVPLMNWRGLDRFVAREAISMIRDSVLKRKLRIDSNNPELLALYHLNPLYYPKAFEKFLMQARKGKNKSEKHWELTAKELMAMEGRLK